jgi:hypothetical protein
MRTDAYFALSVKPAKLPLSKARLYPRYSASVRPALQDLH